MIAKYLVSALALISAAIATEISFPSLKGVGYQNDESSSGLTYLSMAGGAPITVSGLMLATLPELNTIMVEPLWIEGAELIAPPLTQNDEFNSNALQGRIGYKTPSAMELFQVDYDAFNGEYLPNGSTENLDFSVKVYNADEMFSTHCLSANNCKLQYKRDYTAMLVDVTPANVYKDQMIQFHVNPKNAHRDAGTPSDAWPFREIRLGGTLVDWEETVEQTDRLSSWRVGQINAHVGDQMPGMPSEPQLLFHNGHALNMPSARKCNFAGDECWTVKTHPKIESLSGNTGYITGGQNLRIYGHGLNGTDVAVLVDGVTCEVVATEIDFIECITGEAQQESAEGYQPGQPGLKHEKISSTTDYQAIGTEDPASETSLYTSFETLRNQDSYYVQALSGWFKAPVSGEYRFLIACDDKCRLSLDTQNFFFPGYDPLITAPEPTIIAERTWASSWRDYFYANTESDQHKSEWISLEEGAQYYIRGETIENGGEESFTVSVEIKPLVEETTSTDINSDINSLIDDSTAPHPMANPTLMQIAVEQTNTHEEWTLIVTNPDEHPIKINFLDPTSLKPSFWSSEPFEANAAAWVFRSNIRGYFLDTFGSDISVERTMHDDMGVETTDASLAVTYTYTVKLLKMIEGFSANAVSVTKVDSLTQASFLATPPNRGIQSSKPLNGTYQLWCKDEYGTDYGTPDMNFNLNPTWVQNTISNYIPFLADKVEVLYDYRYSYAENGISYLIRFTGIQRDMELCEILPGSGDYPLSGNDNREYNITILEHFGEKLIFEPIPLEFLSSDAQQPQVLVTVDGMEALCASLNCDYTYTTTDSLITSQTINDDGLLVLEGVNLPTDSLTVEFGPIQCEIIAQTSDFIECQLTETRVTGDWIATVTHELGLISHEISEEIHVPAIIEEVYPTLDINFLGGDYIFITGQGFGYDIDAISVFIGATPCQVIEVIMSSMMVCEVGRMTDMTDTTTEMTLSVTINGVAAEDQTLGLTETVDQATELHPSSASPVLKTELEVFLASDYSEPLNREDFTAYLYKDDDVLYEKELYVMSVDEAMKSVKIKFPGAKSGDYHIQLVSEQHGRINSDPLALKVHGSITSVSPLQGSIFGGTLVTITGENFSDDALDNPVKIGDDYCYVITTSPTEITCRTDFLADGAASTELLIVFLKTSEEAFHETDIEFTYVAPLAEIMSLTADFDMSSMTHQVTVQGANLDDTLQLVIDGIEQRLVSVETDVAVFEVVGLNGIATDDVQIFTSEGYPWGSEISHFLEFAPSILQITPSQGSAGSSWIQVTGSGFGPMTSGLNLKTSAGSHVCQEVEIIEYGVFNCLTVAEDMDYSLSVVIESIDSTLSFIDATYAQTASILADSLQMNGDQIIFLGSGFPTTDFTAHASVGGVEASSVISFNNEVIATWTETGIPAATGETPLVWFEHNDGQYSHFAKVMGTIDQAIDVTTSTMVECSFAGGCHYEIGAQGLTATLMSSADNTVEVCGSQCVLNEELSTSETAVCVVPSLATTYSVEQFKITESHNLVGKVFPADSVLQDDDVQIDHTATSAECTFGMTFKQDHVGVLDEAKVFIGFMTDKNHYVNNLIFQGSNDNWETFTDLYTFTQVHEGWNYIDYRDADKPAFNSYRYFGLIADACRVTEFKLLGVEAINNEEELYTCDPVVTIGGAVQSFVMEPVVYAGAMTPKLDSISPRFGSVLGGTFVHFTGSNFGTFGTVLIDDRECLIESYTDTAIVCMTSDKPYVPDEPRITINVEGKGNVATQGLVYRYVSLWSDTETWGGDIPPLEGESVSIPKGQHLLVDVDSTPILNALIVEGSLIFPPDENNSTHVRTFDAHYVMINGGYMEVGTEDFPYTSKLVITMHSDKYSPYLPIYGNKVIGVRFGTIDMHGIKRDIVWTNLAATANPGDVEITLAEETDWAIGEEIVIAGTSFKNTDHETRFITDIAGTTVTLNEPLEFSHLSVTPTYDGVEFPMRAEVGLLTRNVVFRGDEETSSDNLYGAHIMIHSPGDESSVGRIEYIELKDVGQAFKLGRYPIHFHMIGTVHKSYVKGNAIHQTYNRAVTTHGVHYFRVIDNVSYDTMGHTFFIEDAAETKNIYDHNLAIKVKKSLSLLNTDQTPGGFWITHPDNVVINNAIAGTDAYGYWYDMQVHAMGPSFDVNVCPEYEKLGQFSDNSAHSTRKYGLRLFHALIPRTDACSSSPYDADYLSKGETDPYWQNPKIPAIFERMTAWKCGRNGAITERTGAVVFKDFKIADNLIAGMEFSVIEDVKDDYAKIEGGIVVGNSGLNDDDGTIAMMTLWGVIGARTENFSVDGTSFYNFDQTDSAALGTCSHCFHGAATDSGARTMKVKNLKFDDATVPRRILYQVPFREIIFDMDGSLTGLGAESWATFFYPHLDQPECQHIPEIYNGLICDSTIQVRRIAFYDAQPASFRMIPMKVAKWEEAFEEELLADEEALFNFKQDVDHENFSILEFRGKKDPMNSWAAAYVTNHRYRIHWGENLDFTKMRVQMSERWEEDDFNTYFMTNFTDVRVAINITDSAGTLIDNETLTKKRWDYHDNGDNVIYNQTEVREFHFVMNGKEQENRTELVIEGFRCIVDCDQPDVEEEEISDVVVLWSDPLSWPNEKVPEEGEEAEVTPGTNMLFDIDESPLLKQLTINGRLSFDNNAESPRNQSLHTKILYVRQGELLIGSEEEPYNGNAEIRLYGEPEDETIAYHVGVETGNKVLAIVGLVKMYGQQRDQMSRLRESVFKSDQTATVASGLDWKAGDQVALLPTATQMDHTDYMIIETYDNRTGEIYFTEPLYYYHFGQASSTEGAFNGVDMRGEVVLLSRNVKIVGNDTDQWGGQIVVSDNFEESGVFREGELHLENVEIYNCSQRNTFKSAIRFEMVNTKSQVVRNTVVHGSRAWPISSFYSSNILIEGSTFIGARAIGIGVIGSGNVTIDKSIIADIERREELTAQSMVDIEACVSLCAYFGAEDCRDVKITNSIAAGCPYAGFIAPAHECGESETQDVFRNNVAHSIDGSGGHIIPTSSSTKQCMEGSYFAAYKTAEVGLGIYKDSAEIRMSHMTMIDNTKGVSLHAGTGNEEREQLVVLEDSYIFGEAGSDDCPPSPHKCWCQSKQGIMLFGATHGSKPPHITKPSSLPYYKLKSYGSWLADIQLNNNVFQGFENNETLCGASQKIFKRNPSASDYIPLHKLKGNTFIDVHDDAVAFIEDPKPGWANPDDCIGFPCTAPSNVVLLFEDTRFSGKTPLLRDAKFQIISDTPGASEAIDNCEFKEIWNAWQCQNSYLGVLNFIGDDADWEDRSVGPVYVTNEESGFTNKLNSMMDHVWDGFYTGQLHKSQFPSLIQTNRDHTVEYTGTPFNNMRYQLIADKGSMKIKVPYWNAGSYEVLVDGEVIPETPWDKEAGRNSELTGNRGCGENRFVGVQNFLEFWITEGCIVTVRPVDAIKCNVRMQWTLAEFYASGGVTSFTDRVAGALGIHASQIKIVAVYKGSVVVDYFISPDADDDRPETTLRSLQSSLNTLLTSGTNAFGAPVLSANTEDVAILEDPTYNPTPNNQVVENFTNDIVAPVVEQKKPQEVKVETITITKQEKTKIAAVGASAGLIWMLAVFLVIVFLCAVCGSALVCCMRKSAQKDITKKAQAPASRADDAQNNVGGSEVDIQVQYQPNEELEMDIFTNKKREMKFNDDNLNTFIDGTDVNQDMTEMTQQNLAVNQSEKKLIQMQLSDRAGKSELQFKDE